jgi:mono/diheme cytochrome c family protein
MTDVARMRKSPAFSPLLGIFCCLIALLLGGPAAFAEGQGMMGGGCMGMNCMGQDMMGGNSGSMARHHQGMMGGVPEPYSSLTDPLPDNAEVLSRGRAVYRNSCASCHGPAGLGDGEGGRELSPRPANLARLSRMPMMMGDSYLYWTIAEGGDAFGTAMPAHKDTLSADEIWSVIRFLQAGLPPS